MSANPATMINAKIETFPSLPSVVSRIMELTADPDSSVDELLDVVQFDQSLTATILKMSNSAFFGQVRAVSSLKQAISVLGMNEIQNIAVAKAIFNSFKAIDRSSYNIKSFWMHSFLCGLSAKLLSVHTDESAEDMFIAGLIHDIGKLVILLTLPTEFTAITTSADSKPFRAHLIETSAIGITHGDIGLSLLNRWMFPDNLVMAAGYHHFPEKAEIKQIYPAIMHLSDMMAYLNMRPELKENPDVQLFIAGESMCTVADTAGIKWDKLFIETHLTELEELKLQALETFELILS